MIQINSIRGMQQTSRPIYLLCHGWIFISKEKIDIKIGDIELLFYKLDLNGLMAEYNCFYNYFKSDIEYFMNKNELASLIYKKDIKTTRKHWSI